MKKNRLIVGALLVIFVTVGLYAQPRYHFDWDEVIAQFLQADPRKIGIAFAYFESCRAFVASPELVTITPQQCVLLMVASGGASIVQLPVFGWFTQIIAVAAVLSAGFGVAKEAATAGAATLLLVTFLCIVPVGLIWAQFEHVSLRRVTVYSEQAEEDLEAAKATE